MSVTITIEASNAAMARMEMEMLLRAPNLAPANEPVQAEVSVTKSSRGRKARPTTEQPITDINENGDPVETKAEAPSAPATQSADDKKEEAKTLLKKLASGPKGEDAAWELLKKYDAKKLSDVFAAEKADEFIADLKAALA